MAEIEPMRAPVRIDVAREPQFTLGQARVVPSELALEIGGRRRELQPRVMRVLIALSSARPKVVSRDSLLEQCWDGRIVGDDAINRCILALRHLANEFEPPLFAIETVPRVGHRLIQNSAPTFVPSPALRPSLKWAIGGFGLILAALFATLLLEYTKRPRVSSRERLASVAIEPARDSASAALAQDITTKLGMLAQTQAATMRLVRASQGSVQNADLVVQVSRNGDTAGAKANIMFISPGDGVILWTKEFDGSSANSPDFRQQIAYSTGRVLGCAVDAIGSRNSPNEEDLKTYLNACAALTQSTGEAARLLNPMRELVLRSPLFAGGWATLLQLETQEAEDTDESQRGQALSALGRDLRAARSYFPDLPEAYIARYELTPPADLLGRSHILDNAVAHNPGNSEAHVERAMFLESVGRINDALGDAHEAVELDPLSPTARDDYIIALALAGRTDAANAELARAERIWPGATTSLMTQYVFHLRFGDARRALRLLRSGLIDTPAAQMQEAFLEARIAPTQENTDRAIRVARTAMRFSPEAIDNYLQTLAQFHRNEELISFLTKWHQMDSVDLITGVIFRPAFSDMLRDPRFMNVADHLGLLSYWQKSGQWPDFCLAPDLPYDCKAITARPIGS